MKGRERVRSSGTLLAAIAAALLLVAPSAWAELDKFVITVQRGKPVGEWVAGTLSVNGKVIGPTLERNAVKIPAGTYKGTMRYASEKGFAQGPFGTYSRKGDFLLEVSGVKGRTDILLHGGTLPKHSDGCLLLGGIAKDKKKGVKYVPDAITLRKLRLAFYGKDVPDSTPAVDIEIVIEDADEEPEAPATGCDWTAAVSCVKVESRTGKRCGKPASYEIDYTNTCAYNIKVVSCVQYATQKWTCMPDGEFETGLKPNHTKNAYACEGTGQHRIFAMPVEAFLKGKCRYPKL